MLATVMLSLMSRAARSDAQPVPMRLRVDPAGSSPGLVDRWIARGAELVTDVGFDTLWLSSDRELSETCCTRKVCMV